MRLGVSCVLMEEFDSVEALENKWRCEKAFAPAMDGNSRDALLRDWGRAVARITDG